MMSDQTTLGSVNGAEVGWLVPSVRSDAPKTERLDEPDEPGRRLELVLPLHGTFGSIRSANQYLITCRENQNQ